MGLDEHADLGTFFLRLAVGGYLMWAGGALLWNARLQAALSSLFAGSQMIPPGSADSAVMLYLTLHILLGALILLGLFTRAAGLVLAIGSVFTMAVLNWHLTPALVGSLGIISMAKDILLLGAGASLFFSGSRMLGIDCIMME